MGYNAGESNQRSNAVAMGPYGGQCRQRSKAIAVGIAMNMAVAIFMGTTMTMASVTRRAIAIVTADSMYDTDWKHDKGHHHD